MTTDRDEAIRLIKAHLKRRSDRTWSVTGGRGTAWGWITITAPPKRRDVYGSMTEDDQAELTRLLGKQVHHQGESIPASNAYRIEFIDRAHGLEPAKVGTPYWD